MAFIQNFLTTDVDSVEEGIGFSLPFTFEPAVITKTTLDSTRVNLTSLLSTNKGERVFQPNLGVNLNKYLFQQMGGPEAFAALEEEIIEQISIWLPFLQVEKVDITPNSETNLVKVNITYSFVQNPELTESVQVDLNTGASY